MALFWKKDLHKWGDKTAFNKAYAYPKGRPLPADPEKGSNEPGNLILSENICLNMDTQKTFKNNNVFVVGGIGSGKTESYAIPNILQRRTSYIVTDPMGYIYDATSEVLKDAGYIVKVFDLHNIGNGLKYNPLTYITTNADISAMASCITACTADGGLDGDNVFLRQSCTSLIAAVISYVWSKFPEKDKNFNSTYQFLCGHNLCGLDRIFGKYEYEDPEAFSIQAYRMFRTGACDSAEKILESAKLRMRIFENEDLSIATSVDSMHLEDIGDYKQAIFIKLPAQCSTYGFLAMIMAVQLSALMSKKSEEGKNRFILRWDASSPIQSRNFGGGEKNEVRNEFEDRLRRYRQAHIEDLPATINGCTCVITDCRGKMLIIGNENGRPAMFERRSQAEYFMECINRGTIEAGSTELPSHVHVILNGFDLFGPIPGLAQYIDAINGRQGISFSLLAQTRAHAKAVYKKELDQIISSCSTKLFMGTKCYEDAEWISQTIGPDGSPLIQTATVLGLPRDECIIMVDGCSPMLDKKRKV